MLHGEFIYNIWKQGHERIIQPFSFSWMFHYIKQISYTSDHEYYLIVIYYYNSRNDPRIFGIIYTASYVEAHGNDNTVNFYKFLIYWTTPIWETWSISKLSSPICLYYKFFITYSTNWNWKKIQRPRQNAHGNNEE